MNSGCWRELGIRNSPRQSVNAEAFAEAYLRFLVSASAKKKNAEAIGWWNFKLQTCFYD